MGVHNRFIRPGGHWGTWCRPTSQPRAEHPNGLHLNCGWVVERSTVLGRCTHVCRCFQQFLLVAMIQPVLTKRYNDENLQIWKKKKNRKRVPRLTATSALSLYCITVYKGTSTTQREQKDTYSEDIIRCYTSIPFTRTINTTVHVIQYIIRHVLHTSVRSILQLRVLPHVAMNKSGSSYY